MVIVRQLHKVSPLLGCCYNWPNLSMAKIKYFFKNLYTLGPRM